MAGLAEGRKRVVLVTGAGSGLGKAIAMQFARSGAEVLATVRDAARASSLTAESAAAGLHIRYFSLEITSQESVEALAAEVDRTHGLDVLVNNAGMGVFGPIEEVDAEATLRQFDVNVFGQLRITRHFLPVLRERKGCVIWISSLAGRLAMPFQAHYSATKAAIASFSDALRMEVAPFGVRVTCVEPGDFATGFTDARENKALGQSPYAADMQACLGAVDRQERSGANPEWVAKVVEKLSKSKNPPARRPVGRWARTICFLQGLLPDSIRERLVCSQYRLGNR